MTRTTALVTARLRMRPYREDDINRLWRLWTDAGVRRYLWDDTVIARDTAAEAVRDSMSCTAEHGFGHWAVCHRDGGDDEVIGFCGLRIHEALPEVELMYGFYPARWGRGLAAEGSRAWLRYGFEMLDKPRIWAVTDAPNERSQAVMRRLGMRFDRRFEQNGLDTVCYAIDREDFTPTDEPYEVVR
jgi:ribosomal-protein-alanine N-acetyltransferase